MSARSEFYPPPNLAEDFESLCLDIFKTVWDDPYAKKHGRSGQAQAGVDVYGLQQGRQMGVQCKKRDARLRSRLTVRELNKEVEAARAFRPKLDTFIVAITGPADTKIQDRVRQINAEKNAEKDVDFRVDVWTWDDEIWPEIYKRKELLRHFKEVYWPRIQDSQRIAPSRLTHTAPKLFGREQRLQGLDDAWNDPGKNVVSIIAWGGVGKTCLVTSWVAQLAERQFDGADYFDWSFYSQGTRDFVNKALEFFGDPEMANSARSAWDKGGRLAELVGRRRALLVLDGLEPLQYPPGPMDGELKDPAIQSLLKGLAAKNAGLCVVTSRVGIKNLESFRPTTAPEWSLEHLSISAGVQLLESLGVQGTAAEMKGAVQDVDGHALTLNLLGRFLKRAHKGDVRRRDRVKFHKADAKTQGGHAFRAMDAYAKWLAEGGEDGIRQIAVLRLLGLFDRPASADCLNALRQAPAIDGVTDVLVDLDDEDWNLTVSDLDDVKLVARGLDDSLDAHPLIREYFANCLRRDSEDGWKAAHERLFDYLQASTEFRPDSVEGLQPLYQAVAHGCLAGREREACDEVYRTRVLRENSNYSTFNLGLIGADLGAIACFFERPWTQVVSVINEAGQAWLLNEAAFRLRAFGRLRDAVEPMKTSLDMCIEQKSWRQAAIRANNLSEMYLTLGDAEKAVHHGEQAVDLADGKPNVHLRLTFLTTLGEALSKMGLLSDAWKRFQKAEILQAEKSPEYHLLYGIRGFRYCDLMQVEAERLAWQANSKRSNLVQSAETSLDELVVVCKEVTSRAIQTLKWAHRNRAPILDFALDHLILGRARLHEAVLGGHELVDASNAIESAVEELRRAGTLDHLPRGLLTRAWLRALTDDPDGAQTDLDEAWEIAERGPMPLFQADVHLHRARLFEDRAALMEARRLIEKHGYGLRLGELEDAEAWLLEGEEEAG